MEENEPYLIPNNRKKIKKKNKKDYNADSEEEDNNEENESISEIKKISTKRNKNIIDEDSENDIPIIKKNKEKITSNNNNNFQNDINQYDEEKNESVSINISKAHTDAEKLLKQLKDSEKELNEKNNIIKNLKKEISEKENKIKLITKTNNKLKLSLNEISKKIDDKLFNNKNLFERKSKYNNKSNNYDDELKQKELDNAMNIIKILKNDNHRLQTAIDNYEKNNKLKDLENINKIKEDENINLENQVKMLKKELKSYNIYLKKCKIYENQIEILNSEIKTLKDNIKILKNKIGNKMPKNNSTIDINQGNINKGYLSPKKIDNFNKNISYIKKSRNMFNSNSDRYKINLNDNYISLNNRETYGILNNKTSNLHQSMGSLPSINLKNKIIIKNNTPMGLNSFKKNYNNINDILKKFFNENDIELINKIFQNNAKGFEAFKLKLCIINKSKETLNTKYNLEIKKYNERIISAQEQIEYLNTKIRESEVNYRVLQTQMNEFLIQKKLLLKKIKKLEENIIEKDNILKLNFAGEDINNEETNNKNDANEENDSNKNSDVDGSSKIAKDEDLSVSDKSKKKTENSQSSVDK